MADAGDATVAAHMTPAAIAQRAAQHAALRPQQAPRGALGAPSLLRPSRAARAGPPATPGGAPRPGALSPTPTGAVATVTATPAGARPPGADAPAPSPSMASPAAVAGPTTLVGLFTSLCAKEGGALVSAVTDMKSTGPTGMLAMLRQYFPKHKVGATRAKKALAPALIEHLGKLQTCVRDARAGGADNDDAGLRDIYDRVQELTGSAAAADVYGEPPPEEEESPAAPSGLCWRQGEYPRLIHCVACPENRFMLNVEMNGGERETHDDKNILKFWEAVAITYNNPEVSFAHRHITSEGEGKIAHMDPNDTGTYRDESVLKGKWSDLKTAMTSSHLKYNASGQNNPTARIWHFFKEHFDPSTNDKQKIPQAVIYLHYMLKHKDNKDMMAFSNRLIDAEASFDSLYKKKHGTTSKKTPGSGSKRSYGALMSMDEDGLRTMMNTDTTAQKDSARAQQDIAKAALRKASAAEYGAAAAFLEHRDKMEPAEKNTFREIMRASLGRLASALGGDRSESPAAPLPVDVEQGQGQAAPPRRGNSPSWSASDDDDAT